MRSLLRDLYDGEDTFLDVSLLGTLTAIDAEQAAKKPAGANSIWEIANHIIAWRENILKRISGAEIITPEHNYFMPIVDQSESAWRQTLESLRESQRHWDEFLANFPDDALSGVYPKNGMTHYRHIHSLIQHDAYHLGQIVMLARHFT